MLSLLKCKPDSCTSQWVTASYGTSTSILPNRLKIDHPTELNFSKESLYLFGIVEDCFYSRSAHIYFHQLRIFGNRLVIIPGRWNIQMKNLATSATLTLLYPSCGCRFSVCLGGQWEVSETADRRGQFPSGRVRKSRGDDLDTEEKG